jgi:hypothetical protein
MTNPTKAETPHMSTLSNDETLVQVHSMSPYVSVQEGE